MGSFNRREPIYMNIIYQHPGVVTIFENCQWLGFFEKLRCFDNEVTKEFSMILQNHEGHGFFTIVT